MHLQERLSRTAVPIVYCRVKVAQRSECSVCSREEVRYRSMCE